MKEITDQTDLGSQNSMLIAFGLGDAVTVDEIQIRWPSGVTETLTDIPANQLLEILETKISLPSAESQDDSYPMNETGFSDSHGYYNDFRTGEKLHGPNMENDAGSTATPSGSNMSGVKTSTLVDTYYIYAFDGKLMAEYDHNGNCVKEYIYLGGQLIAEYQPQTSKCYYYASDQINSTRVVLDETADIVHSSAYGPYGQALDNITTTYEPKLKFSGKEREGYSDLDYFGGRYYDHQSFRFNSVDPIINRAEALVNPQLWNLYAYCRNSPITYVDPDGKSDKDVRQIWNTYRNEVIRMTESGERNSSQIINGISGTVAMIFGNVEPYKNCAFQEENVRFKLSENEYDDKWVFEAEETKIFGLPWHTKGKARSKNPNDPLITYDPFKDEFCVYYSGEDRFERYKEFSEYVKSTNKETKGSEEKNDK